MKSAGTPRHGVAGRLASLTVVALAVAAAVYAFRRSARNPSSDDATIDADVVHVAALVGGRIARIPVTENARVAKGDVLFQIDDTAYRLTVQQATADLEIATAVLDTQHRFLSTQRSTAAVASEQTRRALANFSLAERTTGRLRPLNAKGYVPTQQLDQAEVLERDAATSLRQAREHEAAAVRAIDTDKAAEATMRARQTALAIARKALDDTTVRAPHDGLVVGLRVTPGEVVIPSQSLFTLIDTEAWFAEANFRETDLHAIAVGDHATVYCMIDRRRAIEGTVEGIGWGVLTGDRINLPRSVPYVEPSLNWVRVAHRFPVKVKLKNPPPDLMRVGASAVVEIHHDNAGR